MPLGAGREQCIGHCYHKRTNFLGKAGLYQYHPVVVPVY